MEVECARCHAPTCWPTVDKAPAQWLRVEGWAAVALSTLYSPWRRHLKLPFP
ncbi:hypothetical protein [Oryza sativa Japonica Group]|uniref:Uncharacterized protein n=1 Tax=Oryza sativa subsp. japonica TaxID=39947 RepID=Q5SMX8_ORYSJ|nr:hypothetical protein [Oryza sativa Japonica Group]BAD72427.1 hypothetical protein [Oryza sativa Japonica Group]